MKSKFSRSPLFLAGGFLGGFSHLTGLLNLDDGLDDANYEDVNIPSLNRRERERTSNGLSHVTDGETSKRWVVGESLDTHWLGWHHLDDRSLIGELATKRG